MDPYFGSIINRLYNIAKIKVYIRQLPEQFQTPSLYFPRPDVNEVSGGLNFEFAENVTRVTIFHKDETDAYDIANDIKNDLIQSRKFIQVVDAEGRPQEEFFKVKDIAIRSSSSDKTATMTFTYSTEQVYGRADYLSAEYVNITNEVI